MPSSRQSRNAAKKLKVNNENLDPEQKKKLRAILKDFDCAVKAHIQKWEKESDVLCKRIQGEYQSRIFALPQRIRDMNKEEYLAQSGHQEALYQTATTAQTAKSMKATPSVFFKLGSHPIMKKKEENTNSFSAPVPHKKGKRKNSTTTSSEFVKKNVKTPVVMLKNITNFKTPRMDKHILGPAVITPKFDTRLPLTPAFLRRPRIGEVIISMAGSPLQNTTDSEEEKPGVIVSLGSGKVVSITEDTGVDAVQAELDHKTKSSLLLVQKKLTELLQKHGT